MAHADLRIPLRHEPAAPPGAYALLVVLRDGLLPLGHLEDHVVVVPDLLRDVEDLRTREVRKREQKSARSEAFEPNLSGQEVVLQVEHRLEPLGPAPWREAHPGGQWVVATHHLGLQGAVVQQGAGRLRALPQQVGDVLRLHHLRHALAVHARLPLDPLQEARQPVRHVLHQTVQGAERQLRRLRQLLLGHPQRSKHNNSSYEAIKRSSERAA